VQALPSPRGQYATVPPLFGQCASISACLQFHLLLAWNALQGFIRVLFVHWFGCWIDYTPPTICKPLILWVVCFFGTVPPVFGQWPLSRLVLLQFLRLLAWNAWQGFIRVLFVHWFGCWVDYTAPTICKPLLLWVACFFGTVPPLFGQCASILACTAPISSLVGCWLGMHCRVSSESFLCIDLGAGSIIQLQPFANRCYFG
jgi:hypothetical protein